MDQTYDLDDRIMDLDQLDPSSISLFSGSSPNVEPREEASASREEAKHHPPDGTFIPSVQRGAEPTKKSSEKGKKSFTSYQSGKGAEVARRRNLQERIEKVRSESGGIIFNIPQFKDSSMNQLAMFLRKFGKASESQRLLSPEMRAKIFPEEATTILAAKAGAMGGLHPASALSSNQQHQVICVSDILGPDEDYRQKDDEDELTEESTEEEDEESIQLHGEIENMDSEVPSHEEYDFYRQRMQILAADQQTLALIKRLNEQQQRAKTVLANMPPDFKFAPPSRSGTGEDESMTCARSRALINRPSRKLVRTDFGGSRPKRPTKITSNLALGVQDYSTVDDSIHSYLSLPSAIPMERKMHKYLQVIGSIPAEVEARRLKIGQIAYKKDDKLLRTFYNTTGALITEKPPATGTKAVANAENSLSLTIKKAAKTKQGAAEKKSRAEHTRPSRSSSSSGDSDYDESDGSEASSSHTSRKRREKLGSRRDTSTSQEADAARQRILHCHQFGSTQYLELPTEEDVKKSMSLEIPLPPSYKTSLLPEEGVSRVSDECLIAKRCLSDNEGRWGVIREGHARLEAEEKRRNLLIFQQQQLHNNRGHRTQQ